MSKPADKPPSIEILRERMRIMTAVSDLLRAYLSDATEPAELRRLVELHRALTTACIEGSP
jgi:hypothetical protein